MKKVARSSIKGNVPGRHGAARSHDGGDDRSAGKRERRSSSPPARTPPVWQLVVVLDTLRAELDHFFRRLSGFGFTRDAGGLILLGREREQKRLACALIAMERNGDDALLKTARIYWQERIALKRTAPVLPRKTTSKGVLPRSVGRMQLSRNLAKLACRAVLGETSAEKAIAEANRLRGDGGPADGVEELRPIIGQRGGMSHLNTVYRILAWNSRAIPPDTRRAPREPLATILRVAGINAGIFFNAEVERIKSLSARGGSD